MRKTVLILIILMSGSRIFAEELLTKVYHVLNPWESFNISPEEASDPFDGDPFGGEGSSYDIKKLQSVLTRYGVKFPEGSLIDFEPLLAGLVMHNTAENHEILFKILSLNGLTTIGIFVDTWVIELDSNTLEKFFPEQETGISGEQVLALWREGKGKKRFARGLRMIHGVQTIFQSRLYKGERVSGEMKMDCIATRNSDHTVSLVLKSVLSFPVAVDETEMNRSWEMDTSVVLPENTPVLLGYGPSSDAENYLFFFASATYIQQDGVEIQE